MYIVSIELSRVQTFLFAVPRLRAMLGANAALGETIRGKLVGLAEKVQATEPFAPEELPEYALTDWSDWRDLDPLSAPSAKLAEDYPPDLLRQAGVLAREGGHFRAVFKTAPQAEEFMKAAQEIIVTELPGLPFTISADPPLDQSSSAAKRNARESIGSTEALFDLPVFQVCQVTGREPATEGYHINKNEPVRYRGRLASRLADRGKAFAEGSTQDIVGLLRPLLLGKDKEIAQDFEELAGGGYVAVIHADGNDVGSRLNRWMSTLAPNASAMEYKVRKEMHAEEFFYTMRVAVRRAVVDAVAETFKDWTESTLPYQFLMLGGDDLLLICRPCFAFKFLVEYASGLQKKPLSLADGKPLTIGAGVAIASHHFPFHRLHHLAETLAGSAKRLSRAASPAISTVDWQVVTQSWTEDPAALRRRESRRIYRGAEGTEQLALSRRPYAILGEGGLQDLLTRAQRVREIEEKDRENSAARSQLRALPAALRTGRLHGELAFRRLALETRKVLEDIGYPNTPWRDVDRDPASAPDSERERRDPRRYDTDLADLIELLEIPRLGRS